MSGKVAEIQAGVQAALDQYAQYDSNGNPVTAEVGKKVLNVELATGSAVIGTVAISQVTPGVTNLVQNKQMPDATATFAITPYVSAALEASAVAKASAGNLYGFVYTNGNAATRYVQVFNAASLPANGSVPVLSFPVPGGGVLPFDTGTFPNYYSTGIVIAHSTTQLTLTVAGADALFYVQKH